MWLYYALSFIIIWLLGAFIFRLKGRTSLFYITLFFPLSLIIITFILLVVIVLSPLILILLLAWSITIKNYEIAMYGSKIDVE